MRLGGNIMKIGGKNEIYLLAVVVVIVILAVSQLMACTQFAVMNSKW
jgi:hypothetical protein